MTIRTITKDHLADLAPELRVVNVSSEIPDDDDPLVFWTHHSVKPCLVNLTLFATGQTESKVTHVSTFKRWNGAYGGRPEFIHELAPAIREKLINATEATCANLLRGLKEWWRLLDELESSNTRTGAMITPVRSVKDLTHLHQQVAVQRLNTHDFASLTSVANTTRRALKIHELGWVGPEHRNPKRRLPSPREAHLLFLRIKKGWLATVDHWNLVDSLMAERQLPKSANQILLLQNAQFFKSTLTIWPLQGPTHATADELVSHWEHDKGTKRLAMTRRGLTPAKMYGAFYPNAEDIRMGFHLALVGSGWNPQTMLDLEVDPDPAAETRTPFLRNHPLDPNRYILTGFKDRGKSDHDLHGEWKTDRSPGSIIRTLIDRTWNLRIEVMRKLKEAQGLLAKMIAKGNELAEIQETRGVIVDLQRQSRSVWLYVQRSEIETLTTRNYSGHPVFLRTLIGELNDSSGPGTKIPDITASDLRDIFAEFVYRATGGSILAVKQALGHKRLSSTGKYLDNTVINKISARTFTCYTNEMWDQLKQTGRLDHTILKQVVEQGAITEDQSLRLQNYRDLKKSRIGVGCKDPTRPPQRIDPNFKSDKHSMCAAQRCLLCFEHAVIAPEALSGIAMRLAELRHLQAHIPVEHFSRGGDTSFEAEMQNADVALLGFPKVEVQKLLKMWAAKILSGNHRVPEFQGARRL